MGVVERVTVVVRPCSGALTHLLGDGVRQLGAEAQRVNGVGEVVLGIGGGVPVVLEVVNVHVSVAEATARGKVEVSDDLVDTQVTLDTAALLALLLQSLGVVLARALLDVLALTESPRSLRVRLSDFLAGVAASGFLRVRR